MLDVKSIIPTLDPLLGLETTLPPVRTVEIAHRQRLRFLSQSRRLCVPALKSPEPCRWLSQATESLRDIRCSIPECKRCLRQLSSCRLLAAIPSFPTRALRSSSVSSSPGFENLGHELRLSIIFRVIRFCSSQPNQFANDNSNVLHNAQFSPDQRPCVDGIASSTILAVEKRNCNSCTTLVSR